MTALPDSSHQTEAGRRYFHVFKVEDVVRTLHVIGEMLSVLSFHRLHTEEAPCHSISMSVLTI